jgi:hypothetical protein
MGSKKKSVIFSGNESEPQKEGGNSQGGLSKFKKIMGQKIAD